MTLLHVDHKLDLPHSTIYWIPQWLAAAPAQALFEHLLLRTPWEQPVYHFHGSDVPMPRQVAWYGDEGARYGYSGLNHEPLPWKPELGGVRDDLDTDTGLKFNSVLLNRYRSGKDSVAWHADDERELGTAPVIASVSLGATRMFCLKPKQGGETVKIELSHGSLLIMMGETQKHWLHQIPKTTKPVEERINLTFRQVHH